jgi:hypothetical protein
MFAGRQEKTGRTWGYRAERDWMTVEQMWDRYPERFAGRGIGADDPDPAVVPELASR